MKARIGPLHILGAIAILIWCLLPIAWIVSLSLKPAEETATGSPQFLPKTSTWDNYSEVLGNEDFQRSLINSFGISLIATLLSVIIATLCAYAIARLEFKGKRVVLTIALAIAMFPVVSLVGPLFDQWRLLGLYDTWPGLIIPYMCSRCRWQSGRCRRSSARFRGSWSRRLRSTVPRRGRRSAR